MNKSKRNGSKRLFSMKYKIMLICLCSIVFTIFSISSSTMPRITRELKGATENHLDNFVVDHGEKITASVHEVYETMNTISHSTDRVFNAYMKILQSKDKEAEKLYETHKESLKDDLVHISENTEYKDTVHIVVASGNIVVSSNEKLIETKISDEIMKGFSKEKDTVSVETFYDEATKVVTLTYATPIYYGDTMAGYVVYEQNSLEIDKVLDNYTLIGIAEPRINLLDRNGMAIAHTQDERIGTLTTNEVVLQELESIRNGTYKKEGSQSVNFKSDGDDFTVSYIYLPEMNWMLTMSVSDDMLYSGVNSIVQYYVMIIIMVLLVVMSAIFFVVNTFTRPIVRMGDIIRKVGELDFTIDVDDKQFKNICKRRDEIGDMGNSVEDMVHVVKERLENVLKSSEHVNQAALKLKDITTNISEKATDTSATTEELSAGMEETAARAGESGKGFAMVADEIGNLAQQSSDTVNKISDIVQNVNEAVANMSDCLTDSQEFVVNNVYKDYVIQLETLDAYNKDAENIHGAMNQIDANTQSLYATMQSMTDSLRGITQTMQEAAIGVTDIAQMNSEIGDLTSESYQMVNDTNRIAGELEESISVFKL